MLAGRRFAPGSLIMPDSSHHSPTGVLTPISTASSATQQLPCDPQAERQTRRTGGSAAAVALPARAGRYLLAGELARGGMGAIIRGHDTDLNREVALKVLHEGHEPDEDLRRRFIDEAHITGRLQHPGVVPVYESGRFLDGRPFFAMKLIGGRTLAALLRERRDSQTDRARLLKVFEQACQAVAYAHSNDTIHRDLKPANIMVGAFGEVLVLDWGLAKTLTSDYAPINDAPGTSPLTRSSALTTQPGYILARRPTCRRSKRKATVDPATRGPTCSGWAPSSASCSLGCRPMTATTSARWCGVRKRAMWRRRSLGWRSAATIKC